MSNTAEVTCGKPIAVWLQSVSGVNANPLVAFYDIHGRKREVLFFILSRTPHEMFNHSIFYGLIIGTIYAFEHVSTLRSRARSASEVLRLRSEKNLRMKIRKKKKS
jgi:hypothetical protein